MFLPGGLEIARKLGSNLNSTLLEGEIFDNTEVVMLNSAPGFGVTFQPPADNFKFDMENDCQLYGQLRGDAIQICITPNGTGLVVGE